MPNDQTTGQRTIKLGAYYLNTLRTWRDGIRRHLPFDEKRLATLRRIGSPCADDHAAAMEVRARMLAVVDDALGEIEARESAPNV